MDALLRPEALVSLLTLTALELVLGIDNIVFLSVVTERLPPGQRARARRLGLFGAMFMRVGLLLAISWVMGLTAPLFRALGRAFSGRDVILLVGGLFLVGKATHEIFDKLEVIGGGAHGTGVGARRAKGSFALVIVQIMVLDLVFSLDSVIAAVGMARHLAIMIAAVVIAVIAMMFFAGPVGDFVNRHPSMRVLALSFLLLIGVLLVADGMGRHVPKGYIYFAMAYAFGVELINMRVRKLQAPVLLHGPEEQREGGPPRQPDAAGA